MGHRWGGVVIVGDVAHSFPPDTRVGNNSPLGAVVVLIVLLDILGGYALFDSDVQEYEVAGDENWLALVLNAVFALPYQYRQSGCVWTLALCNTP